MAQGPALLWGHDQTRLQSVLLQTAHKVLQAAVQGLSPHFTNGGGVS